MERLTVNGYASEPVLQKFMAGLEAAVRGTVVEIQRTSSGFTVRLDATGRVMRKKIKPIFIEALQAGAHNLTLESTTSGKSLTHLTA